MRAIAIFAGIACVLACLPLAAALCGAALLLSAAAGLERDR